MRNSADPPLARCAGWWATLSLLVAATFAGCSTSADPSVSAARSAVTAEGAGNHVALDVGDHHACVIRSEGKVFCWGANSASQSNPSVGAGGGSPVLSLASATAVTLPGSDKAVEVALGDNFTCARGQGGAVYCWGSNNDFVNPSLGSGFMPPTAVPVTVASDGAATRTARAIVAGQRHLCILRDDGSVVCHGSNIGFQLGRLASAPADVVRTNGGLPNGALPAGLTPALGGVIKLAAAGSHTCALTDTGTVSCWGRWDGTLTSLAISVSLPDFAGGGPSIVDIAAGGDLTSGGLALSDHTCALRNDRLMFCWGTGSSGQLGNGASANSATPVLVTTAPDVALDSIASISAGADHSCATTLANQTFCWGGNATSQLARMSTGSALFRPSLSEPVPNMANVLAFTAGEGFNCAIVMSGNADAAVSCWGADESGQIGVGWTASAVSSPLFVYTPDLNCSSGFGGSTYQVYTSPHAGAVIDSGHEHTCAFVSRSSCASGYARGIACWGLNDAQQGGANDAALTLPPTFTPLSANILQLSMGGHHGCAVDTLGLVRCWGANDHYQCGQYGVWTVNVPTVVPLTERAVQVSAGDGFTCAVLASSRVACWGSNEFGTLGRENAKFWLPGNPPNFNFPGIGPGASTPDPAYVLDGSSNCGSGCPQLINVKAVSAGENAVCGLLANGRVRCWGWNPRAVASSHATRILGCTLDNRFCDPSTVHDAYFGPIVANVLPFAGPMGANFGGTEVTATSVSMHGAGGCLVTSGGSVSCWGDQDSGRLGNGASTGYINTLSPVLFDETGFPGTGGPPITSVVAVNGGWATKCALRTNGTVFCWGWNARVQTGVPSGQTGINLPNTFSAVGTRVNASNVTLAPFVGAIAVTVGQSHACALTSSSQIYCWGDNTNQQLGSAGGATNIPRQTAL